MPVYSLEGQRPEFPPPGRFWIAPNATIIGKVRLGDEANVWFGCTLRGDNEWISVGARTNLQESCVLHTDMGFPLDIGEDCTIGHRAMLHGCQIGAGTLVGMGATILNGARIGPGCLVGAGALVTEGKEFAAGSLIVGSPARVVRTLDEAAQAGLLKAAAHYVANSQRFAAGLVQIEP